MKSKKIIMTLLIVIAVVSIGVAVSYPIRYKMELDSNNSELEDLSSMRRRVMEEQNIGEADFEDRPAEDLAQAPAEQGQPEDAAPSTEPSATGEAPSETAPVQTGEAPSETAPVQTGVAAVEQPGETPQAEATDIILTPTPRAEATDVILTPTPESVSTPTVGAGETPEPTTVQTAEADQTPEPTPRQPRAMGETPEPTAARTGETVQTAEPTGDVPAVTPVPKATPGLMDLMLNNVIVPTDTPAASSTPLPVTPSPSPTPDRSARDDPDTYKAKEKVKLDESRILPELKDIYELNHHLVGWLYIDDTNIDYPVVQNKEDRTFYLTHDFYGKSNANGQIIMEDKCDPWTPSYNLVLSGHHMNSGAMFGRLGKYKDKAYWETHKIVEFDTLMARKRYVVFAAFYSADYNENEKGFRYSTDIQYKLDADLWLGEIQANQIYETGIEAEFGDEFITLTTCDHSRRSNGRFVVVARRIREGEKIL